MNIFLTGQPAVGKTTLIKYVQKSLSSGTRRNFPLHINGFYTEECREGGERKGFDILYWPCEEENIRLKAKREILSRMAEGGRVKKGVPHVGKYIVNIENVEKYAVSSIDTVHADRRASSGLNQNQLVILDEVGKMEMLCPAFIPAVHKLLDDVPGDKKSASVSHGDESNKMKKIVLGTIPSPRYGRVIEAVENIRARDDVIVIYVTKMNRDELKEVLLETVLDSFTGNLNSPADIRERLESFLYVRPIGAPSMSKSKPKITPAFQNSYEGNCKPCGPLLINDVVPKVLILGETASPLPSNPSLSYCERSMWIVLGGIFGMKFKPIKDISKAHHEDIESYLNLKKSVLDSGICVWDVLATVHTKGGGKAKRRKTSENIPNDIKGFLKKNPSIKMIGFIGVKARRAANLELLTEVELVTLPSSSPANSRMTIDDKVIAWKKPMSKHVSL